MAKKELVGGVSGAVLGMLADLILKLKSGVITEQELARFVNRQNSFGVLENLLIGWQRFYSEVFGIQTDLSSICIPVERQGFGWLVVVLQGMTAQRLFDKCKERFRAWKYTDRNLDEVVTSERSAKDGSYAVWFRDRVEADEELKNKSADNLKQDGVSCITLKERLLLELFYNWKTGNHLDLRNLTLCAGSRDSDGGVPGVDWGSDDGKLGVSWYCTDYRGEYIRSRQAVS